MLRLFKAGQVSLNEKIQLQETFFQYIFLKSEIDFFCSVVLQTFRECI